MGAILGWIATFLGSILKAILPNLLKQGRKPRNVQPGGFDEDLQKDIESSIEDSLK